MNDETKIGRKPLAKPLAGIRHQSTQSVEPPSAVAAQHGFDRVPVPATTLERLEANQAPTPPRRKRASGRTLQFNVKLAQPTIDYIYELANARDIPLAQVIEELVELHRSTPR